MSIFRRTTLACLSVIAGFCAAEAQATMLFKGFAVITNRTNAGLCAKEYDVFESYPILYRANLPADSTPERLVAIGNGAIMFTSNDTTPTLRGAGKASVSGNAYGLPVTIPSVDISLVAPAVASTTTSLTMSGTVKNFGIPGCTVTFRASLTLLPPGGF